MARSVAARCDGKVTPLLHIPERAHAGAVLVASLRMRLRPMRAIVERPAGKITCTGAVEAEYVARFRNIDVQLQRRCLVDTRSADRPTRAKRLHRRSLARMI